MIAEFGAVEGGFPGRMLVFPGKLSRRGEGTLGKLLSDDSLLRDTQALMKKANRALDGLDDAGPITAVGVVARGLF